MPVEPATATVSDLPQAACRNPTTGVLFVVDDWAEARHDIEIEIDKEGWWPGGGYRRGLAGITMLHEPITERWIRQSNRIRC
jgi:hypothetical protein